MVINPQFDYATKFSEGLASVRIGGKSGIGKYGYINKSGSIVINPQFIDSSNFNEGLASFLVSDITEGEKMGFIDMDGKVVIPAQFSTSYLFGNFILMSEFKEGLALVRVGGKDSGKLGYISR